MPHVSEEAVFSRLKRRLAKDGLTLRRYPAGGRWESDLGTLYTTWPNTHTEHTHLDLEEFAREMGVLEPSEVMAE